MSDAIVCNNLYKRYDAGKKAVDAVNGLDLQVEAGECFGLLGPNGAGKTTTVEIFEGLLKPTSGEVEVLGQRWGTGHDHELRQQLGITLQETRLQDKLTVLETLRLFRSFYAEGIEPQEVVALVGLEEKSKARVRKLSGGQRQRLAVACALVCKPKLIFFDEPTTGLDPQARHQLWDLIRVRRQSGTTILLTTHYMDEAEKLCDRVAIIDHGRIIALGSPKELAAGMGPNHVIEFSLEAEDSAEQVPPQRFERLLSVRSAIAEDGGFILTVAEPHVAIPALLRQLERDRLVLTALTTRHVNLEDVFMHLTGRHLSDDQVSTVA